MMSFDLFRNPFVLLDVDLSASAKEIVEAFEEGISEGRYSQGELTAARQALLRPPLRLQAEINSLLDTPRPAWRAILTALRHRQRVPDFRAALAKVPALSRTTVLAQFASSTPSDASLFIAWIDAHSEIRIDVLHSTLQQLRTAAGIAPPERAAVAAALGELREQQSRVLFNGYASPSDSIEPVTDCTTKIISGGNDDRTASLSSLLSAYQRYIDQELSFRRERITVTTAELGTNPDGPGNLVMAVDALKFWNVAAKPLQLLEAHKSRSDPHSQAVFQEIRNVAIKLANERSRFDVALTLTQACRLEFANLPRARDQLIEDENTLKERVTAAKIEPLAALIAKFDSQLHTLTLDLRKHGFGKGAAGLAAPLRNLFVAAVNELKGSAAEELPWFMVRSVALKFNNDRQDPESALELTEGLLELSGELGAPNEIAPLLAADKRAIERNRLEADLVGHLKAGHSKAALSAVENLLRDYKNPEERDTLQNLKSKLERKRTGQYLGWGFWAAVVGGGILLANLDHSASPPPLAPSATYNQAPTPPRDFSETMPPVGTGLLFTEANIRYCQFQNARLNFMKPRLVSNFQIDAFNGLVDDYNSRCGHFRYQQSDLLNVQAELSQRQVELEADAQRIIDSWGPPQ